MFARRAIGHVIVALALLFTQQLLVAHSLTHLSRSAPSGNDESPLPHGKICSLCVQASSAGDALIPSLALAVVAGPHPLAPAPTVSGFVPPLLLAFFSRGPPALL
jgi:hypothetical protein